MEYKGRLYGKIGDKYVPLLATSEDFDNLHQACVAAFDFMKSIGKENSLIGLQLKETLEPVKNNPNGK